MIEVNQSCCPSSKVEGSKVRFAPSLGRTGEEGHRTIWASISLGLLASACCWLPLALAALGVATGSLGAKVAWIRPWALGSLPILLVATLGWWVCKRFAASRMAEDYCGSVPTFPTLAVAILAASFVLAWATPRLLHSGRKSTLVARAPLGNTLLVISTPRFDCAACVGTLPQTLAETPGVASVQMDFDAHETRIAFQAGAAIEAILARWKRELAFEGKVVRQEVISRPTEASGGPEAGPPSSPRLPRSQPRAERDPR